MAERIRLSGEDPENQSTRLAERVGVFDPVRRNPNECGRFSPSRGAAIIWRLHLAASTFVRWRSFSSFASAMSLEMSLATSVSVDRILEFWIGNHLATCQD